MSILGWQGGWRRLTGVIHYFILVCLGDFGQTPGPSSVLFWRRVLRVRFCAYVTGGSYDSTSWYVYNVLKKYPSTGSPVPSTGIRSKKVKNNKNIQPVHEDSKFRTVDLGKTELGTLRTCARVPRARARAARARKKHTSPPTIFYTASTHMYM